ncbi:Aryl-phospho-beta-D-glucosidase BglC, GH1 family [Ruminococcus sp. YE71]|uniref:cellulase family glycosylhydrolase n=1 Tax=unclassified Ruminococcus TaxID=2608920 RepID=UPI00088F506A|nr:MULTISPECIES: cellulase family glycosylhydrolase [unclassified Ruminococcus]SDA23034.1 Aryl-phospho-beta-D-glucosidase BglC, GH1 family [Ruminococcus sp. YE78]SFW39170.1 Aryl-phospho-beta-D-glucosidase BglC, GH1 family [Ruminococcus sp. YE71]
MLKKLLSGVTAAACACSMVLMPGSDVVKSVPAAADAPDSYHDDWLHVNENAEVVDMYGNPVWMTGVNWFGYNVGSQVFDGVWSANMHNCLDIIADHGFNLLRVPMSTEIILQWKNHEPDPILKVNPYENPELVKTFDENGTPIEYMYSFDIWNKAVEWCRENGVKIMMDIHCATTNAAGHNYPLWYDDNYSTDDWLEALSWFCEQYKDDDTVIAIDLKNEPHGKPEEGKFAKWDDSTDLNNWKYAAERGAMACLEQNPNLLIMIEGIECYPDFARGADWTTPAVDYAHYGEPSKVFGAWWGGNLRGVKDNPVDIGKYNSQIVYSPHDYGPLVYEQSWFHLEGKKPNYTSYKFDTQSLLDEYWYDAWAYLVEEHRYPLLMGEWGGFVDEVNDPSGANTQWLTLLRDYMKEKRIHHTFWCFNENSSDTGGLMYDNFQKWDDEKYEFVKPSLWQDENGKFISLDHKVKLGKAGNGISLSDYYSGSHEVEPITVTADYGDANCDGKVDIADAVLIRQYLADPKKHALTEAGKANADCADSGKGITEADALAIEMVVVGKIKTTDLPTT